MRLFVFDPALSGHVGHHYNYNRAILDECRRRAIPVRFLASAACAPAVREEFDAVPCFEVSTYADVEGAPWERMALRHLLANRAVEADLRRCCPGGFGGGDVVLFHTATHDHLHGLLRWHEALPEPRPAVVAQFMFPPWFRAPEADRGLGIELQRRGMRAWAEAPGARVAFACDNGLLAPWLAELAGREVGTLPMPISFPEGARAARAEGGPLTLTYLGEPRGEKGFNELVRALLLHRAEAPRPLRFVIQVTGLRDQGFLDGLRSVLPEDVLVTEPASEERYWELLAASDALLLPYDPEVYRVRSSRILVEAVGMGKPVLVTAGSWLDAELARLGGAGVRVAYEPHAIWAGIADLARGHEALADRARAAAARCREENGPRAFLDAVLACARGLPAAPPAPSVAPTPIAAAPIPPAPMAPAAATPPPAPVPEKPAGPKGATEVTGMAMKVLICTDDFGLGGAAEYTHRLALDLRAQGFEVVYAQARVATDELRRREEAGIRHAFLNYDTINCLLHGVHDRAGPAAILAAETPDFVLFSDCLPESLVGAKEACDFLRIPYGVVKHFVSPDVLSARDEGVRARVRDALSRAGFVVCVSRENAHLLERLVGVGGVRVVYNGRPDRFFEPPSALTRRELRAEWGVPEDAVLVFTAAQIEPRKGFQYQLQAIYVLKEAGLLDRFRFVWAGAENGFSADLEQALTELGCRGHVRLIGRRQDVDRCLDAADVFLLPSQREGMPLAVIEAMAKGVPVAATAVSGIPEALEGGAGALLPDPGVDARETVRETVEVLARWASDPAERRAVGERGRARAEERFRERRTYGEIGDLVRGHAFAPDDHVSDGFERIKADRHFPFMVRGDKPGVTWPWFRKEIPHAWYVDSRRPNVGFLSRDEAHVLYNTGLRFRGRRALEIGCWFGWSAFHLAASGVALDVIDPVLADRTHHESVAASLGGLPGAEVRLWAGPSPDLVRALAEREGRRWSLFFIDGNHEAPGPELDAVECVNWAEPDCLMLFHDLNAPAVADGLRALKRLGWRTRIYDTAQIMGCAWRGAVEPVRHVPDPRVAWTRPAHLADLDTD
jgi:glycosyltransferase involved in cell wall biosynthesis